MNDIDLSANWNRIKGALKQRYGVLTDDDLAFVSGKGEELLGRLQQKLAMGKDELNALLARLNEQAGGFAEQAQSARHTAAGVYEDVKARASDFVHDARANFAHQAEDLRGRAEEAAAAARVRARTLQDDTEEYVRRDPRQALLVAFGLGLVAGLLLRRP